MGAGSQVPFFSQPQLGQLGGGTEGQRGIHGRVIDPPAAAAAVAAAAGLLSRHQ